MTTTKAAEKALEFATPEIPLDLIDRQWNLRGDVGDTSELEGSIENIGLIEPLVVRSDGNGRYVLLAGFRRIAALENLGHKTTPVRVVDHPEEDAETSRISLQLVENLQRVDLTPVEEASGYSQLKKYGWKQREIAKRVGRSEAHISKRLSLLGLPDEVIDLAEAGRITTEDLYELTKVVSADADLAPIVDQIASTDREDTDDPHGEIRHMVKRTIQDKTAEAQVSDRKAELEAEDVTVVDPKSVNYGAAQAPRGVSILGSNPIFDLTRDKHEKEPCHGVMVFAGFNGVAERPVCTDKSRHGPGGDSKLKSTYLQSDADRKKQDEKAKKERQQREERAARRDGALRAAAKRVLSGRAPAKDKILRYTADWLVRRIWEDYGGDVALELLDLMPPGERADVDDWPNLVEFYESADGPNQTKIIVACALGELIDFVSGPYLDEESSEDFKRLMSLLDDLGATVDIDSHQIEGEDE